MGVTDEENATIERMINQGKTALAIRAAVPNVSRTNVYLKIAKFKKHGTVGRVQTKALGRPRAMGESVEKFLQGLLAAKPNMELEEMRRHLQDQLQITVSMSTISRAITRSTLQPGRPHRSRNSAGTRRRIKPVATTTTTTEGTDEAASAVAAAAAAAAAAAHPRSFAHNDQSTQHVHVDEDGLAAWDQMDPVAGPSHHLRQNQHHHLHQQHVLMQMPSHQHDHQHEAMHALDPSLAQPYVPPATAYHNNVYATPNIDYRSPYAPL